MHKKGNLINISGGAIRFAYLIFSFTFLLNFITPTIVTGVSSGSIIAFCYVCGKLKRATFLAYKSHQSDLIFSRKNKPYGKIAGFSIFAIWKILKGKSFAGIMDNLEENLRHTVTPTDFKNYQNNLNSPDCWLMSIDDETHEEVCVNIKDKAVNYEQAISLVMGSSAISPTVKSYLFKSKKIIDGGHRHHSAGSWLMEHTDVLSKVKKCFTIWARVSPKDYNKVPAQKVDNFFRRLLNIISIFIREISLNDEFKEKALCEDNKVKHVSIYAGFPIISTYEITKAQILKGYRLSELEVKRALRSRSDKNKLTYLTKKKHIKQKSNV